MSGCASARSRAAVNRRWEDSACGNNGSRSPKMLSTGIWSIHSTLRTYGSDFRSSTIARSARAPSGVKNWSDAEWTTSTASEFDRLIGSTLGGGLRSDSEGVEVAVAVVSAADWNQLRTISGAA